MPIIDLHCDTLSALQSRRTGQTQLLRENKLHVDLKRLADAGYMAQFFAIFLSTEREEDPLYKCLELIDLFWRELEHNSDIAAFAGSLRDLEENRRAGKISAFLTIEDSGIISGDPALLRVVYRLGVRLVTLTWNYVNSVASPNITAELSSGGLTPNGVDFVREMSRLGMLVDVSHLSDAGFYDVCRELKGPFVASHSNAREVTRHPRNLTDDMIKKLSDHGGVIGLNFCGSFVENYLGEIYAPRENLGCCAEDLVRHAKRLIQVGGIDCVALGSDFDGIGYAPEELTDCAKMPLLVSALERGGFNGEAIEKICWKNAYRVIGEVCRNPVE